MRTRCCRRHPDASLSRKKRDFTSSYDVLPTSLFPLGRHAGTACSTAHAQLPGSVSSPAAAALRCQRAARARHASAGGAALGAGRRLTRCVLAPSVDIAKLKSFLESLPCVCSAGTHRWSLTPAQRARLGAHHRQHWRRRAGVRHHVRSSLLRPRARQGARRHSLSLPPADCGAQGEYAKLIKGKENVDMHLLLDKVGSAVLESAPGRGNYTSHLIRMRDAAGEPHITFYLMWPESAPRGAPRAGRALPGGSLAAQGSTRRARWRPSKRCRRRGARRCRSSCNQPAGALSGGPSAAARAALAPARAPSPPTRRSPAQTPAPRTAPAPPRCPRRRGRRGASRPPPPRAPPCGI